MFFAVILYLTYNFLEMPKPICLNFSVKLILQRVRNTFVPHFS